MIAAAMRPATASGIVLCIKHLLVGKSSDAPTQPLMQKRSDDNVSDAACSFPLPLTNLCAIPIRMFCYRSVCFLKPKLLGKRVAVGPRTDRLILMRHGAALEARRSQQVP